MNQDDRTLIDEKFNGLKTLLNAQFEAVDDKLKRIEEQTQKTNGRVTELEHKELTHTVNCPYKNDLDVVKEDINTFKTSLKNLNFALSYLKPFIVIIILSTMISVVSIISSGVSLSSAIPIKIENAKE